MTEKFRFNSLESWIEHHMEAAIQYAEDNGSFKRNTLLNFAIQIKEHLINNLGNAPYLRDT